MELPDVFREFVWARVNARVNKEDTFARVKSDKTGKLTTERVGLPPIKKPLGGRIVLPSEVLVNHRAQEHLETAMKATFEATGGSPRVTLDHLSESARDHYRQLARIDVDNYLQSPEYRKLEMKQRQKVKVKLHAWHEQREATKKEKEEEEKRAEHLKEIAAKQEKQRWKMRGLDLQKKVGAWAAEKAEREEQEARRKEEEAKAEAAAKARAAKLRRQKYQVPPKDLIGVRARADERLAIGKNESSDQSQLVDGIQTHDEFEQVQNNALGNDAVADEQEDLANPGTA